MLKISVSSFLFIPFRECLSLIRCPACETRIVYKITMIPRPRECTTTHEYGMAAIDEFFTSVTILLHHDRIENQYRMVEALVLEISPNHYKRFLPGEPLSFPFRIVTKITATLLGKYGKAFFLKQLQRHSLRCSDSMSCRLLKNFGVFWLLSDIREGIWVRIMSMFLRMFLTSPTQYPFLPCLSSLANIES